MFVPHSFVVALIMMIASAVCWGSWANTYKGVKNYRFELFYWDYALGIFLISVVLAFTMGSTADDPSRFLTNVHNADNSNIASTMFAGVIFNLAPVGSRAREYRVEKLIYESLPKLYVTADVYVPTTGQRPYPAVLGVAGHTDAGKASAIYQRGWIAMAKRGFLVLAFDPPSQGERVQCYDWNWARSRVGTVTAEHTNVGLQCILTGSNLAQYIVWDGIRGIDYLFTRGDVDPKRLAVAGNSGGGMQSAYLAVVEPRLAAAAPSCYRTSSEKLWRDRTPQDAEQNVIGLLAAGLDLMDFPLAFAPRPFQFLTAIRDFFPIAGARDSYAEARRTYAIMGQPDRVDFFEYDDGHGWSKPRREATYRWFQKWLNNRPSDQGAEPEFETEPESNLWATPTGQLATSLKGETVQSLNADLGERLQKQRPSRNTDELRRTIAARIGAPLARTLGPPPVVGFGEVGRSGYHMVKLALTAEAGITVPVLLFVPDSGAARKPAVIYLQPGGMAADAGPGGPSKRWFAPGGSCLPPTCAVGERAGAPAGGRRTMAHTRYPCAPCSSAKRCRACRSATCCAFSITWPPAATWTRYASW